MPGNLGTPLPALEPTPFRRSRSERLIAGGRFILATSSLLAIWLDPNEPARLVGLTYGLLGAYLVYAAVIAALVSRAEFDSNRWRLTAHAIDLGVFISLTYVSNGPASPFFSYFVFALVSATVRWHWTGTIWTAAVALVAFLGAGVYFSLFLADPAFQLNTFIIRGVYLVVIAALLGQLGAHEQQTLREMSLLAAWPEQEATAEEEAVRGSAEYAARVLGAPRLLMLWSPRDDETWMHLAYWADNNFRWGREPAAGLRPIVADALSTSSFFTPDVRRGLVLYRRSRRRRVKPWHGQPVGAELQQRFAMRSAISLPLQGDMVSGRLFFLDKSELTSDDLLTGEVIASIVSARLDRVYVTRRLEMAAAAQERVRLARDLHDGVLQAFTGVALRLAAARQVITHDQPAAVAAIDQAQQILAHEQRDLRVFVEELRPALSAHEQPGLRQRLSRLAARMREEWRLMVDLDIAETSGELSASLAREAYLIVHEAMMNAVRHGAASEMRIRLATSDGRMDISIADNGRGFPFSGTAGPGSTLLGEFGPRSLRERVDALGGTLTIVSSDAGASLGIVVPMGAA